VTVDQLEQGNKLAARAQRFAANMVPIGAPVTSSKQADSITPMRKVISVDGVRQPVKRLSEPNEDVGFYAAKMAKLAASKVVAKASLQAQQRKLSLMRQNQSRRIVIDGTATATVVQMFNDTASQPMVC